MTACRSKAAAPLAARHSAAVDPKETFRLSGNKSVQAFSRLLFVSPKTRAQLSC
jgi:hypothetical protein